MQMSGFSASDPEIASHPLPRPRFCMMPTIMDVILLRPSSIRAPEYPHESAAPGWRNSNSSRKTCAIHTDSFPILHLERSCQ